MPRVSKLVTYANETLENGERGAPSDLFVSVLIVQVLYTYMHDIQIQSLATHNSSPGFVAPYSPSAGLFSSSANDLDS